MDRALAARFSSCARAMPPRTQTSSSAATSAQGQDILSHELEGKLEEKVVEASNAVDNVKPVRPDCDHGAPDKHTKEQHWGGGLMTTSTSSPPRTRPSPTGSQPTHRRTTRTRWTTRWSRPAAPVGTSPGAWCSSISPARISTSANPPPARKLAAAPMILAGLRPSAALMPAVRPGAVSKAVTALDQLSLEQLGHAVVGFGLFQAGGKTKLLNRIGMFLGREGWKHVDALEPYAPAQWHQRYRVWQPSHVQCRQGLTVCPPAGAESLSFLRTAGS
mmetsp:Transcript_143260/g.445300  ORF Transcript_143260/g.445300 Transcript_143260/m.445300 type:complete len:275 (+) Transcript_143260:269-1093(+)